MRNSSVFCRICVLVFVFSLSVFSQNENLQKSVANSLSLKIFVKHEGFYRLNYDEMLANGFDSFDNPQNIRLFTGGIEQSMQVNANGSIDFFGTPTASRYTSKKVYFLTHGETFGKRWQISKSAFDETIDERQITGEVKHEEKNLRAVYVANGEHDNFYSASLNYGNQYTQTFTLERPFDSVQNVLEIGVQGYSNNIHNVFVLLNNRQIGTLNFGYQTRFTKQFAISEGFLNDGENKLTLVSSNTSGTVLLEYTKISYRRNADAADGFLKFDLPAGQAIRAENFTAQSIDVFDITDSANVRRIRVFPQMQSEDNFVFTLNASGENRKIWSQTESRENVAGIKAVLPNDLRNTNNEADFIILTSENFREPLERLRETREHEGLKTQIINIEDVYDEFNNGEKSPLAIKNFMKFAADNWHLPPQYLLLVGDSSSDPKGYLANSNEDYMPSLTADTLYFPMEASSDDLLTDFDNDNIADIPTGRLSVKNEDEAKTVVNKILQYEESPTANGQRSALFVSDLPVDYNFPEMSDEVLDSIPVKMQKVKINRTDGTAAEVRQNLLDSINRGFDIVNFLGHGNTANWTNASLLRAADGSILTNESRTSVFIMLACLNGSFAESDLSLAEALQKAPNGGAAMVWASSALTYAYGQVEMSKSFYRKIYTQPQTRIGDAVKYAKGTMEDRDIRRFSILFGDPTMHIR